MLVAVLVLSKIGAPPPPKNDEAVVVANKLAAALANKPLVIVDCGAVLIVGDAIIGTLAVVTVEAEVIVAAAGFVDKLNAPKPFELSKTLTVGEVSGVGITEAVI